MPGSTLPGHQPESPPPLVVKGGQKKTMYWVSMQLASQKEKRSDLPNTSVIIVFLHIYIYVYFITYIIEGLSHIFLQFFKKVGTTNQI